MIESIEFVNFKALRATTVPLSPFTLLLGPNGSGKSSVLQALQFIAMHCAGQNPAVWPTVRSVAVADPNSPIKVIVRFRVGSESFVGTFSWSQNQSEGSRQFISSTGDPIGNPTNSPLARWLARMQIFTLDPNMIARAFPVSSGPLHSNGLGLPAVLDDMKDNFPERWELLLKELREWLPEYDHIVFDKPSDGQKAISLRTRKGRHRIPATALSQGTLIALALLTLAYQPEPPPVIGLEEIDRGLHPRLLRHVQDALYRLSYPESCGESRPPIQVIATTHSPYMLDLYRDHPEEIVLASKTGSEVQMQRLKDVEHFQDIVGDSPLSEIWYSGVLGGVSVKP